MLHPLRAGVVAPLRRQSYCAVAGHGAGATQKVVAPDAVPEDNVTVEGMTDAPVPSTAKRSCALTRPPFAGPVMFAALASCSVVPPCVTSSPSWRTRSTFEAG